jgi:xylulokinase
VHESHEVTGKLTTEAADTLGLSTDCVVVGGAGDCAAGAIGNGVVKQGIISTSLGTSGVVFAHSDTPEIDPHGRLHTFCHAVDGKWHMMGVTLSAAGSLEWLVETVESGKLADGAQKPAEVYRRFIDEAAAVAAGADGLFFLPYLSGERTPHADPLARGAFVGLTLSHTRGHLTRSVLEGVTYSLRDCLSIMEELGIKGREIRTTGGGAKSDFWRQMQADMFGKRVVTMASDEGPSMGVALLAAVGGGEYRDIQEACRATVAIRDEAKPRATERKTYQTRWPLYQQLYRSLKGDFDAIARLPS